MGSKGQQEIYISVAAWDDDLHWPQGNLFTTMTLDNARMRLWATVAVTFAGSSLIILLRVYVRVYARGKSSHWVWCDWLNGKPGFSGVLTAAANIDDSVGIRK
jgi:hypothetical protein